MKQLTLTVNLLTLLTASWFYKSESITNSNKAVNHTAENLKFFNKGFFSKYPSVSKFSLQLIDR